MSEALARVWYAFVLMVLGLIIGIAAAFAFDIFRRF